MRMVRPIWLGLVTERCWSVCSVRAILIRTMPPTSADEAARVQLIPTGADQAPFGQFVPASPPRPAPQVSFTDAAGASANLSDFAGKPVLLNLWATWCAPCRREMPSLERLQARLGDKITVLAISEDIGGNKAVAPFIAKFGLKAVKTYLDPKSTLTQAFNVDGLPTSFLIDRRGRVIGRVEGEAEWDSSQNAVGHRAAFVTGRHCQDIVPASTSLRNWPPRRSPFSSIECPIPGQVMVSTATPASVEGGFRGRQRGVGNKRVLGAVNQQDARSRTQLARQQLGSEQPSRKSEDTSCRLERAATRRTATSSCLAKSRPAPSRCRRARERPMRR